MSFGIAMLIAYLPFFLFWALPEAISDWKKAVKEG